MKCIFWNNEKNSKLKKERAISFEEIALRIESGDVVDVLKNPGYPGQFLYVINIDNYAVIVPFVETENEIFLKTAFPSRKYSRLYALGDKHE